MSDSVRPHRQQPTRLPRPWDSPGKNTGLGCHFLLQCMKVKRESEVAQSCLTLCDPMGCSLPGSSVHGIFQARVLEWGAIAFSLLFYCQSPTYILLLKSNFFPLWGPVWFSLWFWYILCTCTPAMGVTMFTHWAAPTSEKNYWHIVGAQ